MQPQRGPATMGCIMNVRALPRRAPGAENDQPGRLSFKAGSRPSEVAEALVQSHFLAGSHPIARYFHLLRSKDAPLLPAGAVELRRVVEASGVVVVAEGDGWVGRFRHDDDADCFVFLVGVDEVLLQAVVTEVEAWARPPVILEGRVEMTFCHITPDGVAKHRRNIDAPAWHDVARNYAGPVQRQVEPLVSFAADDAPGRLLLLHGPPGTGKTSLLRMLARAWAEWCDALYVVDPDRLFHDPGYLHALLLEEPSAEERWRLVLLEDCDELVRPDAKNASGQALSRLLNLTDGMVGQGLKLLVALSTNEPLGSLHPAVTRPGRCLAEIEVGRLQRAEALAWLGYDPGFLPPDGASLAELFAIRSGVTVAPLSLVGAPGYL